MENDEFYEGVVLAPSVASPPAFLLLDNLKSGLMHPIDPLSVEFTLRQILLGLQ